jgi:cytochrome c
MAAAIVLASSADAALAEGPELKPSLGKPVSPADLAPWDITVFPGGTNLPPGTGKAADGEKIFEEKCAAACHGDNGKGGIAGQLIGGPPRRRCSTSSAAPCRTPGHQRTRYRTHARSAVQFSDRRQAQSVRLRSLFHAARM